MTLKQKMILWTILVGIILLAALIVYATLPLPGHAGETPRACMPLDYYPRWLSWLVGGGW